MTTADANVLDDFLNRFRAQVDAGFGLIQGDVTAVLATLVVISITVTAILWAIDENQNVLASLVRKVLLVGFFAFLVSQWPAMTRTVVNGFAALGLKAGGGSMTLTTFTSSPSQVVGAGITVIAGLLHYVRTIAPGPIEFFAHIDVVIMAVIAAIGILIAFIVLAVEIVVTIIEFHIVTLVAFVVVPFGVLAQTSFMSERAIGYVVSVGVKLMALALVVSLGTTVFDSYTVSTDPGISEDVGLLLAAVVMVMLALKVPQIAAALISGGPQLNAGSAAMGAAGVAAGVAGAGLAMRYLAGAAGGLAGAATGAQLGSVKRASGLASPDGGANPPPASSSSSSTPQPPPPPPGRGPDAANPSPDAQSPSPPSASDTVARAEARDHAAGRFITGAVIAASQTQDGGPGMTATPIRAGDEPA